MSSALGYESGDQTKSDAVEEMKDAKAHSTNQPPTQNSVLASVEKTAGNLTGCDGMVDEGKARMPSGGSEEQSGTG